MFSYDELGNKFTWKTLQSMVSGANDQNMDKYAGKCVSLYATADNKGASSIIWRIDVTEYFADGDQLKITYVDGSCNDPASDHSNAAGDVQSSLEAMAAAAPCGQNVPSDPASNGGSGSKTAGNLSEIEAATYEVSNGLNFGGSFIISKASQIGWSACAELSHP